MSLLGKTAGVCMIVLACMVAPFGASTASADELDNLFLRILVNPTDVDLNLEYARLAEEKGILRKALATYERILLQDPENEAARDGYHRVRRALEPAYTDFTVTLGGRYETNPRQEVGGNGHDDDFTSRLQLDLRDERPLMGRRWRTEASVLGDLHADISDLDFFRGEVITGPVFDVGSRVRVHTGVGGAYINLDGSDLYTEAAARIGIEGILAGALQRLDARFAYRDIGNRYSDANGLVLDVVGRLTRPNVLVDNDVFAFYPRFRFSEATDGRSSPAVPDRLYPGDYFEYGASTAYYYPLTETVVLGLRLSGYFRDYDQSVQGGGKQREDVFLSPGVQLVFKEALGPKTAVRLEYRYEKNWSNDNPEDFENHVIGVRASKGF